MRLCSCGEERSLAETRPGQYCEKSIDWLEMLRLKPKLPLQQCAKFEPQGKSEEGGLQAKRSKPIDSMLF